MDALALKNGTMSSLEIAELTGKRHSDVLEAIRVMEPAWEKVAGRKFPLSEYKDSTGRKGCAFEKEEGAISCQLTAFCFAHNRRDKKPVKLIIVK